MKAIRDTLREAEPAHTARRTVSGDEVLGVVNDELARVVPLVVDKGDQVSIVLGLCVLPRDKGELSAAQVRLQRDVNVLESGVIKLDEAIVKGDLVPGSRPVRRVVRELMSLAHYRRADDGEVTSDGTQLMLPDLPRSHVENPLVGIQPVIWVMAAIERHRVMIGPAALHHHFILSSIERIHGVEDHPSLAVEPADIRGARRVPRKDSKP